MLQRVPIRTAAAAPSRLLATTATTITSPSLLVTTRFLFTNATTSRGKPAARFSPTNSKGPARSTPNFSKARGSRNPPKFSKARGSRNPPKFPKGPGRPTPPEFSQAPARPTPPKFSQAPGRPTPPKFSQAPARPTPPKHFNIAPAPSVKKSPQEPFGGKVKKIILKYHVARTKAGNLPVYKENTSGRTKKATLIRRVSGNGAALKADIAKELNLPLEDLRVNPITGHITIKGWHMDLVSEFLGSRGF